MLRYLVLCLVFACALPAQMPRGQYAWWNSPVVQDLKLSDSQRREIRLTVKDYRVRLLDIRARMEKAESDLETLFNQDPVDTPKANEAIDRLASTRSELTRALSQMSLKLRSLLSVQQWQQLQDYQTSHPRRRK
jgi:Spy/CpxP family protein refolding chaperone